MTSEESKQSMAFGSRWIQTLASDLDIEVEVDAGALSVATLEAIASRVEHHSIGTESREAIEDDQQQAIDAAMVHLLRDESWL